MEDKIEQFWRSATADDVARVMKGEAVEARFRNEDSQEWQDEPFTGWTKTDHADDFVWSGSLGISYRFCQVYDPPEILKNKPDPGEGCRLLEKFPPEDKQTGDEWFSYKTNDWVYAGSSKIQRADVWYRRRIETNIPTSSDSSRSRDNIPSGWRLLGKDEDRIASDAYWSQSCKEWLLIGDDRVEYANELPRWHAIRQVKFEDFFMLTVGRHYSLPGGVDIRITAKGFELATD